MSQRSTSSLSSSQNSLQLDNKITKVRFKESPQVIKTKQLNQEPQFVRSRSGFHKKFKKRRSRQYDAERMREKRVPKITSDEDIYPTHDLFNYQEQNMSDFTEGVGNSNDFIPISNFEVPLVARIPCFHL